MKLSWSGLSKAVLHLNLLLACGVGLWQVLRALTVLLATHTSPGLGGDFYIYRANALLVWDHGWTTYPYSGTYAIEPPLQVLLNLPFLLLSPLTGYCLWTLVSIGCLFLSMRLISSRPLWHYAVALLLVPSLYALALGQVIFFIALIITLAWWLALRGHGFTAGLVLSLATLKPQLILLFPLVLLFASRKRELLGLLTGLCAIGLLTLSLVGLGGIQQILANQHASLLAQSSNTLVPSMILALWFPGWLGLGLTLLAGILALLVAYRLRSQGPAVIFAVGILGSLLITPYFHPQDLVLWIIAALLIYRSVGLPRWLAALGFLCSWEAIYGVPIVSILALLVAGSRPDTAPSTDRVFAPTSPVLVARSEPSALA